MLLLLLLVNNDKNSYTENNKHEKLFFFIFFSVFFNLHVYFKLVRRKLYVLSFLSFKFLNLEFFPEFIFFFNFFFIFICTALSLQLIPVLYNFNFHSILHKNQKRRFTYLFPFYCNEHQIIKKSSKTYNERKLHIYLWNQIKFK